MKTILKTNNSNNKQNSVSTIIQYNIKANKKTTSILKWKKNFTKIIIKINIKIKFKMNIEIIATKINNLTKMLKIKIYLLINNNKYNFQDKLSNNSSKNCINSSRFSFNNNSKIKFRNTNLTKYKKINQINIKKRKNRN